MIKAIVVDDEKLVRKGFISMINWAACGIAVIGEAADGHGAIELLSRTEVNLVFADITMPGMSGLELIRHIRQQWPHIRSVVLTCHHEFDYVQEALRLGALDYIVKTLLEMENADETIARIAERFRWEEAVRGHGTPSGTAKLMPAPSALVFLELLPGADATELFLLSAVRSNPFIQLDGIGLVPLVHSASLDELAREMTRTLRANWQPALVTGLLDLPEEQVRQNLLQRLENAVFYLNPASGVPIIPYEQLTCSRSKDAEEPAAGMDWWKRYADLRWAFGAAEWHSLVKAAEGDRPAPSLWPALGKALCRDWQGRLFGAAEGEALERSALSNQTWADWKNWLRQAADCIQRRMVELNMTKEVMQCLIRALLYMREHAGDKINQSDVADHVKMSRSYFSQCFARLAGEPFNVVLRAMRMERAKAYLLDSDTPVYEIAQSVGFEDDKYFSKLFRDLVGKYPTEFRMMGGKPF